jgi:tetratricopeptide (TPR) repeat protein
MKIHSRKRALIVLRRLTASAGRLSWIHPVFVLAICCAGLIALNCAAQDADKATVARQRVFAPEGLVRLTHFRELQANRGVFFGGGTKSVDRVPPSLVESPQIRKDIARRESEIEQDPLNVALLLQLAEIKSQVGQREQAIALLHRVQQIDKDSVAAHSLLSRTWLDLDDLDRSYRHAEAAIELDRNDAAGFVARAVVRHYLGLTQLALQDIDQAIALAPQAAKPYALKAIYLLTIGQNRLAVATCEQGLELEPENRFVLGVRCDMLYSSGDLSSAYRLSKDALELHPDDMTLLSLQISTSSEMNRLTESLDHCDHVLEGDPASIFTRRLRASLNARLKNIEQVRDDCKKLLSLDGESMETALYVLQSYIQIDDMQQAKSAQQHAAEIAAEIHNPRFNALLQQMTADLQKKLRFLE